MKIIISIPYSLLEAVNHTALRLGMTRNRFFIKAVSRYIREVEAKNVTGRLNRVYTNESPDDSKIAYDVAYAQAAILRAAKW